MITFNWKSHYTGIDVAEAGGLYLNRSTKTKALTFIRYSAKMFGKYRMLGIFLDGTNHLGHDAGFEIFTNDTHFGYIKPKALNHQKVSVRWSGSSAEPYHSWTIRIGYKKFGWIGFGGTSWKWLSNWKKKRMDAYWESVYEMDPACDEQFGDPYEEEYAMVINETERRY